MTLLYINYFILSSMSIYFSITAYNVGSVALTVILVVQLGYKTFFNHESQLIIED